MSAKTATYFGSGPGTSASLCCVCGWGDCSYLDLTPHVAHEADGEHEAQDAPWPAITP
jgi:hypothetical protein